VSYGSYSRAAHRSSASRPLETQWQRQRRSGPILSMEQPRRSLFSRIWGKG